MVSDKTLLEVCNNGSAAEAERAFTTLYKRHKHFVLRVAMRYVRDHNMALDVLQETFCYLLRKLPPAGDGLDLTSQLTTLLYPVAKNSAISMLRKSNRFPSDADRKPDDLRAPVAQDGGDIGSLLAALSHERREVIQLRFVDDLSLQEIAEALQIPLGTVKSRLHLAIKQLRNSPEIEKNHFS